MELRPTGTTRVTMTRTMAVTSSTLRLVRSKITSLHRASLHSTAGASKHIVATLKTADISRRSCRAGLLLVGTVAGAASLQSRSPSLCDAAHASTLALTTNHEVELLNARKEIDRQSMTPLAVLLRILHSIFRTLYLSALFGPLLMGKPLCRWTGCEDAWWRWCVRCFDSSGALLIKLAQWSSSRPDLFGSAACAQFAHSCRAVTDTGDDPIEKP